MSYLFRLQGIKIYWLIQFLEYLRTLSLKFQKARTKIEVVLALPSWLSQAQLNLVAKVWHPLNIYTVTVSENCTKARCNISQIHFKLHFPFQDSVQGHQNRKTQDGWVRRGTNHSKIKRGAVYGWECIPSDNILANFSLLTHSLYVTHSSCDRKGWWFFGMLGLSVRNYFRRSCGEKSPCYSHPLIVIA